MHEHDPLTAPSMAYDHAHSTKSRPAEIAVALDAQVDEAAHLVERFGLLADRLSAVLRDPEPQPSADIAVVPDARTHLAARLNDLTLAVASVSRRIDDLLDRLEL